VSRNILAARNTERLRTLVEAGALLAFDFDGTLAPMGDDPAGTRMREESAELLRHLAHATPVAVISGRSVSDLTPRLAGIPLVAVIGNHGAEPSPFAARAAREVAGWMPALSAAVSGVPGLFIENKTQSVSVHYWHVDDPANARRVIEEAVPFLGTPVQVVHGIGLVNLIPAGAPDKGAALETLRVAHGRAAALFVGDELTDEPAFRVTADAPSLGVRVGRWHESAAAYHIPSQLDIDALLTELLVATTRPSRAVAGR
jgi:trehalose 6-phosphate phosphatase